MIKNQKKLESSGRAVDFFRWVQQKKYTVLEDFSLQILEKKGACSDSEIAEILCLKEYDIAVIMRDLEKEYSGDVQGDSSMRSLCDNFSRKLPGVAIAVGKEPEEIKGITGDQDKEIIRFLNQFHDRIKPGGKHKNFRQDDNAKRYVLKISTVFDYDNEDTQFFCDDIEVPVVLKKKLKELLLPKGKSPQ